MRYFITGIDTEVGKTVVSAILTEALKADYWKPVQSGELNNTDSNKIKKWVHPTAIIYPEAYRLTQPLSPHLSAKLDGVNIQLQNIVPPASQNLIIEGAGGVLVPIDEQGNYIIDIIPFCEAETIIVTKHYLGSINHTLLTIEALKHRKIKIKGIVVVGEENQETEHIIQNNTKIPILFRVPYTTKVDRTFIQQQAEAIAEII